MNEITFIGARGEFSPNILSTFGHTRFCKEIFIHYIIDAIVLRSIDLFSWDTL